MLEIDMAQLQKDVGKVKLFLDNTAKKQIPFATVQTINHTLERIKKNDETNIKHVFNKPISTTKRSIFIVKSHTKRLPFQGKVGIKDIFKSGKGGMPASKYLEPHVKGGPRKIKGSERHLRKSGIMPRNRWLVHGDDAKLNVAGNITNSRYVKMLSEVRGFKEKGFTANRPKSRKKASFFVMRGVGIYERKGKNIKSQLIFASKKPTYKKRFDFYGIARKTHSRHFQSQFKVEFRKAMATAR